MEFSVPPLWADGGRAGCQKVIRSCLCVFVGFEFLTDDNQCQVFPAGTRAGTGPAPATLWAGIRAREEGLELSQDGGASCLQGGQDAELKLLHINHQAGRPSSGSGLLSGRSGRSTKESIRLDRLEEVT